MACIVAVIRNSLIILLLYWSSFCQDTDDSQGLGILYSCCVTIDGKDFAKYVNFLRERGGRS